MKQAILVINVGSSSLKFALYSASKKIDAPFLSGKVVNIGATADCEIHDVEGIENKSASLEIIPLSTNHQSTINAVIKWIAKHDDGYVITAIGHRVVHGGERFDNPVIITQAIMEDIRSLTPLAPLHQPQALSVIENIFVQYPNIVQIACFDTSFHRTQPRLAQLMPLPRNILDEGVKRYGFHGLSYDYISSVLPKFLGQRAEGRIVVAHLGNGASMCALLNGKSIATTMGYTVLDGLMMGQRCGSIDPGVVLYLMNNMGLGPSEIEEVLYKKSGLVGVSGISNDMKVLEDSSAPFAEEAIQLFCYRAAAELGALSAKLHGLDAIIFTAGIGENSPQVRRLICSYFDWLGLSLDEEANINNHIKISRETSKIDVLNIPTNEEIVIAKAVRQLVFEIAGKEP